MNYYTMAQINRVFNLIFFLEVSMLAEDFLTVNLKLEQTFKELVDSNDLGNFKSLLEQNPSVNIAFENNILLAQACAKGDWQFVNFLLTFNDVVSNISVLHNRALRFATRHNHFEIVKKLLEYSAVKEAINVKKNLILAEAVNSKNVNLLRFFLQFDALHQNIASNKNDPFLIALTNGDLPIVDLMLTYPTVLDKLTKNVSVAFSTVFKNKHILVANRLLDEPSVRTAIPFKFKFIKKVIDLGDIQLLKRCLNLSVGYHFLANRKNDILRRASKNDNLEVINQLLKLKEFKQGFSFKILLRTVRKGNLTIAKRFLALPSIFKKFEKNPLEVTLAAIDSHHQETINYFVEFGLVQNVIAKTIDHFIKYIAENGNSSTFTNCLRLNAVQNYKVANIPSLFEAILQGGSVEILEYFLKDKDFDKIALNTPGILSKLACHGHVEMLKKMLVYPHILCHLATDGYQALVISIKKGHVDFAGFLLSYFEVQENVANDTNAALYYAIIGGHDDLVDRLLLYPSVTQTLSFDIYSAIINAPHDKFEPLLASLLSVPSVMNTISQNNNMILLKAIKRGHFNAVQKLLSLDKVIENITALENYGLKLAAKHNHLPILNLLLTFPQVVDHITDHNNAAYRAAANYGNFTIIDRLNEFDAVRNYSSTLAYIAHFPENAMRALTTHQLNAISVLKTFLADAFAKYGKEKILQDFKTFLIAAYDKNPIFDEERSLPLEFTPALSYELKVKYYQHICHTAYRYVFLNPNPWISMQANLALENQQGEPIAADIPEAQRELIAYIWLALTEKTFPLPTDQSREDLQERFITDLSLMARQHNWDKTRETSTGTEEEYDDLEGDKPTCPTGVPQGIAQILEVLLVNLGADFKPLSPGIMKRDFKSALISHNNGKGLFDHLSSFSIDELSEIKNSLTSLVIDNFGKMETLEACERAVLGRLEISHQNVEEFIQTCETHFGAQRITEACSHPITWVNESFTTYAEFIRYLAKTALSLFYTEINNKIDKLIEGLQSTSNVTEFPIVLPPSNNFLPGFNSTRTLTNARALTSARAADSSPKIDFRP